MKYFDLVEFYNTVFLLTNSNRLSLFEIQSMYPWEYEIYISLLNAHLEEETRKTQEKLQREQLS